MTLRRPDPHAIVMTAQGQPIQAWELAAQYYQDIARMAGHPIEDLQLRAADEGEGDTQERTLVRVADDGTAIVELYEPIDSWFGLDVNEIVSELDRLRPERALLLLQSPGGFVVEALFLYESLLRMQRPADRSAASWGMELAVDVVSYAGSSATVVLLAGKPRTMPRTGTLMIHAPYGYASLWGNRVEWEAQYAERHRQISHVEGQCIAVYAHQTAMNAKEVLDQFVAGALWLTGEGALERGFVTALSDDDDPPPTPSPAPSNPSPEARSVDLRSQARAIRQLHQEEKRGGS